MDIEVKELDSGATMLKGNGPCELCQVDKWPCSTEDLESGFSPGASSDFRRACHTLNWESKADNAADFILGPYDE